MELRTAVLGSLAVTGAVVICGQTNQPASEPRYDAATVVDAIGTLAEIRDVPRGSSLSGVHVTVRTEKETVEVYLAPAGFLKEMGVTLGRGEQVHVIGSRTKFGGGFVVLAREVRTIDTTLYQRDQRGNPYWPPEKSRT